MIISIIAAMDRNQLIGNKNQLPWYLPVDLAHFKKVTMGKPVLMGRKTFDSIGKPLPGRTNIVLTRSDNFQYENVVVENNLEAAISHVKTDEVIVIGGSTIYKLALSITDRLYMTHVDFSFEGDAWFPEIDFKLWEVTESINTKTDDKNKYNCRFVTYQRK